MIDHIAEAERLEREKEESFQRCDTDGFVSQWAAGIQADVHRLQAEIDKAGGTIDFRSLLDADGNRVPAHMVQAYCKFSHSYRSVWRVEDPDTGETLDWVPAFKNGPRSKMYKLGYSEGLESVPAKAKIMGRGTGLSGQAWASVVRLDGGYPGRKWHND